jgi:hypothetical protein
MGNLGLAVRGIEVYLPLSANFTLGFLCSSIAEKVLDGHSKATTLRQYTDVEIPAAERIGYLADAIRYGHAVPSLPQNVDFGNSLQVASAERFVFSATPDFQIAEAMLEDNPDLARGPRFGVQ